MKSLSPRKNFSARDYISVNPQPESNWNETPNEIFLWVELEETELIQSPDKCYRALDFASIRVWYERIKKATTLLEYFPDMKWRYYFQIYAEV